MSDVYYCVSVCIYSYSHACLHTKHFCTSTVYKPFGFFCLLVKSFLFLRQHKHRELASLLFTFVFFPFVLCPFILGQWLLRTLYLISRECTGVMCKCVSLSGGGWICCCGLTQGNTTCVWVCVCGSRWRLVEEEGEGVEQIEEWLFGTLGLIKHC